MDEFLDDMDDEQVDDLLMPEEDETSSSQSGQGAIPAPGG